MAFSILTTVALLLVAVISYDHVVSLLDFSDAPIAQKSWRDLFLGKSSSIKTIFSDAYTKYSKNGKLFRLGRSQYVLPPVLLEQSRKLPTTVLNSSMANEAMLYLSPSLGHDYWEVINFTRQYVTRSMHSLIPSAQEEITYSFREFFPPKDAPTVEKDGKTFFSVTLHPTMLSMVGMISTKILFGKGYSRDRKFTDLAGVYANGVAIQSLLVNNVCPSLLKDAVVKYVLPYLPNARRAQDVKEYLRKDVLSCISANESSLEADNDADPLNFCLLPMMVKYVQKNPEYKDASPEKVLNGVMGRTLGLLFAAVDTTTITSTHIIFDLVGHPKALYADPIVEEIRRIAEEHDGVWNIASLGKLRLLDSFVKESQRLHAVGISLGSRLVTAKDGYTFHPEGPVTKPVHFAQGDIVHTPLVGVHLDPDVYANPKEFQGFRFAKDAVPSSQPSDTFMAFGHGRHACPGRHLALNMLKMMMIDFLLNYDWIEIARPEDFEFLTNTLPDLKKDIQIRRKTTTTTTTTAAA